VFVGFIPIGGGISTNGSQFFEGRTRGVFEIVKGMGIGGDEKGAGKVAAKIVEGHGMGIGRGGAMNVVELNVGMTGDFARGGGAGMETLREGFGKGRTMDFGFGTPNDVFPAAVGRVEPTIFVVTLRSQQTGRKGEIVVDVGIFEM